MSTQAKCLKLRQTKISPIRLARTRKTINKPETGAWSHDNIIYAKSTDPWVFDGSYSGVRGFCAGSVLGVLQVVHGGTVDGEVQQQGTPGRRPDGWARSQDMLCEESRRCRSWQTVVKSWSSAERFTVESRLGNWNIIWYSWKGIRRYEKGMQTYNRLTLTMWEHEHEVCRFTDTEAITIIERDSQDIAV